MNKTRPININPLSIRLPLPAWVSIAHRLSGILVFLLIPCLLWALQLSLVSPEGMAQLKDHLLHPAYKVLLWLLIAGLLFHLFAGIRHLLMDINVGDSKQGGRLGSLIVIAVTLITFVIAFVKWGL